MDLKAIIAAMKKNLADQKAAFKALSEATEDDAKTAAQEKLDGLKSAYEGLKAQADEAKARIEAEAEVKALEGLETEPVIDAKAKIDGAAPAEAKDHNAEAKAHEDAFYKLMAGGVQDLSGKEMELLTPKSTSFKDGKKGVVMPKSLATMIMGKGYARSMGFVGKALPMLSTDALRSALIPEEYIANLLMLPAEPAHVMDRATVVPTQTGTLTWPVGVQTDANEYAGVTVGWISEGAQKPDSEAEFEQLQISAHELAAYTELSFRLLNRSAIQMEPLLARLFRGAVMDALDTAFLTGSGTGQPLGIVNTTGIRTVARTTAGTVVWQDYVNLEFQLRSYHRAGAEYAVQDAVLRVNKLATDTDGRQLFTRSVADGMYDRLNGYRYWGTHRLPAIGTTGDVVFAQWREYIIPMEQEVVIKSSDDFRFRNNLRSYVVYVVVGGEMSQPRAAAILEGES